MNTSTRRRRDPDVPALDTPERQAHACHAEKLRRILADQFGIRPQMVAPTSDNKGVVRLTFAELETLMYDDDDEGDEDEEVDDGLRD